MKTNINNWAGKLRIVILLIITGSLSACIEERVIVKVAKDGSGYIEHFSYNNVDSSMNATFAAIAGPEGKASDTPTALENKFNDEYFENFAHSIGEGVSVKEYKLGKNEAGMEGYQVTYTFKDINNISVKTRDDHGNEDELSDKKDHLTPAPGFSMNDGILKVKIPRELDAAMDDVPVQSNIGSVPPQMLSMMAAMFDGTHIAIRIEALDDIQETNAQHRDGNTVTLSDIRVNELLKDNAALTSLQKIETLSRSELQTFADKTAGLDIDTQEEIVIKF